MSLAFSMYNKSSQPLTTSDSPTFAGLDLTGITNGNIPYMSASGFADSLLSTDGTDISSSGHIKTTVASKGFRIKTPNSLPAGYNSAPTAEVVYFGLNHGDLGGVADHTNFEHAGIQLDGRKASADGAFLVRTQKAGGSGVLRIPLRVFAGETSNVLTISGTDGFVGMGEIAPVTQLEMTGTAPYITLHNSTHENGDGGRECRLIARGEQDGGEETILGYMEFAHDGAADDEKGLFRVLLNDGNDGTTPSITPIQCYSNGTVEFTKTVYFDTEVDNGNSGEADTIDWTAGNKQKSTLTANCTFTFNPEPAGPCSLTLKLVQDATGSRLVTWPGDVYWPGGTAPTLSTGVGDVDIITFYYDGTDFYGQSALDFS